VGLTFVELAKTVLSLADYEEVRSLRSSPGYYYSIITESLQYYYSIILLSGDASSIRRYRIHPQSFSQNLLSNPRHLEYH